MASSLVALPEELISAIASYASTSSLVNLALASKQLNRIAKGQLYNCITFKDRNEQVNYKKLHSLVINLLQHPEYAAYLEHLQIRGCWPPNLLRHTPFEDLHPVLRDNVCSITGHSSQFSHWDEAEALFLVLFRLSPNLRTLESSLPSESRQHWARLLSLTANLLPNLREVAIVEVGEDGEDGHHGHFNQSSLFNFPKMESVFVYNFKALQWDWERDITQLTHGNLEYMDHVMATIRSRFGPSPPVVSHYVPNAAIRHLEVTDAYLDLFSLVDLIHAYPALRTFALDFRKDSVPEHPCFFNALIPVLSTRAETLTALSIGGFYEDGRESAPPLDFSALGNLNHLRISVSAFLGDTSNAQSISDDRMRERFPGSLQKLVLLVCKREEHHMLPALQHYIDVEPPIMPNLRVLEVCCHAPEAMHAWLHDAAQRHGIHLRVFRKLKIPQEDLFIIPFVNTVEKTKQEIPQVEITTIPPVSTLLLEDLMPLEEYTPDAEVVVPIFEDASMHAA